MTAGLTEATAADQEAGLRALLELATPETARPVVPAPKAAWRSWRPSPLACILVAQAALSLRLVWANTAFSDEALYLWAGRAEWAHWLHGSPVPAFPVYFSGAPVIYPPFGALADSIGGLAGARLLSLSFALIATVLLHGVTRRLYGRRAAAFAAALFAALGSAQFLGAFATYDAMALMLLGLATWLAVRAAEHERIRRMMLLAGAGGALALADAAKYAAALFDPVVLALAVLVVWRATGRRRDGVFAGAIVAAVLAVLVCGAIRVGGPAYWHGIEFTTLSRTHGSSSAFGVLVVSAGWVGLIGGLAAIGIAVAAVTQPVPARMCAVVLAGAILLAPANQARIQVFTSLFKHVGFGAWFASAVAGFALASLADAVPKVKKRGATIAASCVAVFGLVTGTLLAQTHFADWPDSTSYIAAMRATLAAHPGRVLGGDTDPLIQYYLPRSAAGSTFYVTWFFGYNGQHGAPAFADAIRHRYFSVIALSFDAQTAGDDGRIRKDVYSEGGYALAATIPYRAAGSTSAYQIWVRQ